jgi:hypothetical protein
MQKPHFFVYFFVDNPSGWDYIKDKWMRDSDNNEPEGMR